MIAFFVGWPWFVFAFLIVALSALSGVIGLSFTRRFVVPRFGHIAHQNEVTGFLHHGILIIYGLAVALLAIAVWEKYSEVKKTVSSEAVAIGALYRDTRGYPEPVRGRLQGQLKAYTEQIIHEAWPMQRRGQIPSAGVDLMNRFQDELFAFEPATQGQMALHMETLRAYNVLIQARRLRLDFVKDALPAPMWAVVLVGALLTVVSAYFFDVGSMRLHRIMVVMLSGILGLLIFLIAFYDRPYQGANAITPEAYELIHDQLMAPH